MPTSQTAPAKGSPDAKHNGSDKDPLAQAIAHEQNLVAEAKQLREDQGYDGRMTSKLLADLRSLLTAPIPHHYIGHTPAGSQSYTDRHGKERPWPPHDITGIQGAQVQATRMSNVLGRQHWRALSWDKKDGQLRKLIVIVGNDLHQAKVGPDGQLEPNGAEILITEEGWGAYNKGPDPANHYKGAETNAIKRIFARIGPGEEVYRQEVDLELRPEDREAPVPAEDQPSQIETVDADRAAHLRDLFDSAGIEVRALKIKLGALGVSARTVNQGLASLTPVQADELEQWMKAEAQGQAVSS